MSGQGVVETTGDLFVARAGCEAAVAAVLEAFGLEAHAQTDERGRSALDIGGRSYESPEEWRAAGDERSLTERLQLLQAEGTAWGWAWSARQYGAVEWLDSYIGDADASSPLATMSLQAAVRTLEELGVAVERFDPDKKDEEEGEA